MRLLFFMICILTSWANAYADLPDFFEPKEAPLVKILKFNTELSDSEPYLQVYRDLDVGYYKYFLEFHGFPIDKEIFLSFRRVVQKDKEKWQFAEKFFLKNGGMILIKNKPMGHLFYLSSRGFLPGERLYLRFDTKEGDFSQEIDFIPLPFLAKNRAKRVMLEAELLSVGPTSYRIKFPGMDPDENISLQANSDNLLIPKHLSTKEFIFSPEVEGQNGGMAQLIVTRRRGQKVKMNIPWGTEFLKFLEKSMFYKS